MLVAKGSTQKIGFRFITALKGFKVGRLRDWRRKYISCSYSKSEWSKRDVWRCNIQDYILLRTVMALPRATLKCFTKRFTDATIGVFFFLNIFFFFRRAGAGANGIFSRRLDFSTFNLLPKHKVNSYQIKVCTLKLGELHYRKEKITI